MKNSISNKKNILRQEMIKRRNDLQESQIKDCSEKIINKLLSLKLYKESSIITVYIDFNNEVSTRSFIEETIKCGKKVVVPVILKEKGKKKLFLSQIKNINEDLVKGELGILTPKQNKLSLIDPSLVDLCIMSGLAYDITGNRLGFGAGYYDRLLKELNISTPTIALAYDFQVVDSVPVSDNDMKVKIIITEKQITKIN